MATQRRYDWSQFQLGIWIEAKPQKLFDLWSTPAGLTRWFLRQAAFAPSDGPPASRRTLGDLPPFDELTPRNDATSCQTNDRYCWEWYFNGGIISEEWIRESRPPTKLAFGFGDRMVVDVTIRKQGMWCEVNLRQHGIPLTPAGRHDLHMGCRVAWAFFLTNLKSVAEGGRDLRETDHHRTTQLHLVNI